MPRPLLSLSLGLVCSLVAQEAPRSLGDLSLEELGNIDITSVLKRPEPLSQAAAAVFVITREDIRRAGVTILPEALRLAPNLQVAQVSSSQYTIGARGLNSGDVNKLLVLVDGRTVYSPLHSGVFWDAQDLLLGDVERIEVIAGPGGTLWGSNAVNGVINILTRNAKETEGTLITAAAGPENRYLLGARHGGRLSDRASYRIYGKVLQMDDSASPAGTPAMDGWHRVQGGFRIDWAAGDDTLTFQGDAYQALMDQASLADQRIDGQNLLGRWGRALAPDSHLEVQLYADRTHRDLPTVFGETVSTFDLDVTHRFRVGDRDEIVWGGGYRATEDDVRNSALLAFLPAHKDLHLGNVFAQDTRSFLRGRLSLTVGAKLEHNVYTGWEFQPSARLAWKPEADHLVWAAISRAVRTPSRLDRDLYVNLPPILVLNGGPGFHSEKVVAFEAGYRAQATSRFSLSVSPFYNVYQELRTLEVKDQVLGNQMAGHTWGAELWGELRLTEHWRLKPGYAYLRTSLHLQPGSSDPIGPPEAGNDARHRFQVTSHWNVTSNFEIDGTLRHLSALPNPAVPAYWGLNLHLAWRLSPRLEVSLVGQNLLSPRHPEFGAPGARKELERGGMARVLWTF